MGSLSLFLSLSHGADAIFRYTGYGATGCQSEVIGRVMYEVRMHVIPDAMRCDAMPTGAVVLLFFFRVYLVPLCGWLLLFLIREDVQGQAASNWKVIDSNRRSEGAITLTCRNFWTFGRR